jgi:hypothetical protein
MRRGACCVSGPAYDQDRWLAPDIAAAAAF